MTAKKSNTPKRARDTGRFAKLNACPECGNDGPHAKPFCGRCGSELYGAKAMVMKLDPDGQPRAWGSAPTVEAARVVADAQLAKYRAKKAEVGDPLADAQYTESVEWVLPKVSP